MKLFRGLKKFFGDLLKGPGNQYWDLGRCGAALGMVSFNGLAFYKVFAGQDVGLIDYGTGFGAVALAVGGLIALKDRAGAAASEPRQVEVVNSDRNPVPVEAS